MSPHVISTTTDELAPGITIPVCQMMKPMVRQRVSCPTDWLAGSTRSLLRPPQAPFSGTWYSPWSPRGPTEARGGAAGPPDTQREGPCHGHLTSQSSYNSQGLALQNCPTPDTQGPLGQQGPGTSSVQVRTSLALQSEFLSGVPLRHLPMSEVSPARGKAHLLFF